MKRWRHLAGILGFLAVFAASLPVVAAAWTPLADAAPMRMTGSQPCPHCHDCDPCQTASGACVQICVSPMPTLPPTGFVLPVVDRGAIGVPSPLAVLHGLSPSPDPFPPRS